MDIVWIVLGIIVLVVGLIGCVLPGIPGPPLSYGALLLLQLKQEPPFTTKFLIIWAAIAIGVTLLDYLVPALGAKKFGGTKQGVWGAVIGVVLGLIFFPPFGIIIGPLIGALVGELIAGKKGDDAMKSALGTLIGFISGVVLKLIAAGMMAWFFFTHMV